MTLKAQKRFINHCQNKHCFPSQNFIGNTWSLSSREGEGRLPPRTLQVAFSSIRDGHFCVENYKLEMTQADPKYEVERSLHQATAYDPESDRLFIHGGFDLNKALSDTWTFSFKANQWTKFPENPSQR